MDELMSSLLVNHHGQLLPASLASPPSTRGTADAARVQRVAANARSSVESRPLAQEEPVKVEDCVRRMACVNDKHNDAESARTAKAHVLRESSVTHRNDNNTNILPSLTKTTLQPKLDHLQTPQLAIATKTRGVPHSTSPRMSLTDLDELRSTLNRSDIEYIAPQIDEDMDFSIPEAKVDDDYLLPCGPVIGLQDLADYERAHPFVPSIRRVVPPLRKAEPAKLANNDGTHASIFHNECQARGLRPEFAYSEPFQGCFRVTVTIGGQLLGEVGLFASKKDAKEVVCEQSLPKLEAFAILKKRKNSSMDQEIISLLPEGLDSCEWIGEVIRYAMTNRLPPPQWNISGVHPTQGPWFCTVTLLDSPHPPFGTGMGPFGVKNDAKKVAAMSAVQWLQSQGKLTALVKKRRTSGAQQNVLAEGQIQPQVMDMNVPDSGPQGRSEAQKVHDKAAALGFVQPAFCINQLDGSFVTMHAVFNPRDAAKEPTLRGEVCKTDRIFGKKNAKEECCRELLNILDEIERSRRATASR